MPIIHAKKGRIFFLESAKMVKLLRLFFRRPPFLFFKEFYILLCMDGKIELTAFYVFSVPYMLSCTMFFYVFLLSFSGKEISNK